MDSFANLEDWYRIALNAQEDEQPFSVLIGNKSTFYNCLFFLSQAIVTIIAICCVTDDLQHMSAVRLDSHAEFARENDMASFLMSAKNGDQVNQAFWKIASYLAGIKLFPLHWHRVAYLIAK